MGFLGLWLVGPGESGAPGAAAPGAAPATPAKGGLIMGCPIRGCPIMGCIMGAPGPPAADMPKPGCALIGGTMAPPGGAAPGAPGAPGAAPAMGAPAAAQLVGATWGVQLAPPVSFFSLSGSFFFTPRSPIRLASDESRSPPMVLVGVGVAGGAAAMPPPVMGAPMLPAVLPAELPPVLWGVTAGISKSPNPPNTWEEGGNGRTSEKQHGLQTRKSLI